MREVYKAAIREFNDEERGIFDNNKIGLPFGNSNN